MTHLFLMASAAALLCLTPRAVVAQELPPADGLTPEDDNQAVSSPSHFLLVEHRVGPPPSAVPTVVPRTMLGFAVARPQAALASAPARILALIRAAETRHALPRGLLEALVQVESAYQPFVVSRAGAIGLAQLMPATARALGVLNPFDVRANLDGGARFLRAMLDRFGSVTLALAAYNAGPGAVLRSRGVPANSETPAYVRKILAAWNSGNAPWRAE